MKRYWSVVGQTAIPLTRLAAADFPNAPNVAAVPVFYCPGLGVWPLAASDVVIVAEIDPKDIEE